MDEGRVGGPLIRPLSYYLHYDHNSTEKLLLEADLLFNELQASSSSSDPSSPLTATRLLTKTRDPLPNAAPTKRQRVEQGAEDERYERVEVSELEQASAGQTAEPSRDSDKKKKKTKERKSRVAEKNTKKDEKEKAKGKRARRSADEARQEDEEEEEQPKRRRRIRRTEDKKAGQARPTTSSDGRWKTGKYVCAEHFRDKCATCTERTPVYLKYGITFTVQKGRNFGCLHPLREFPGEPCGVRFTTQHELVEHRLAHEASERPGGLVRQEVLDRRLEVSAAVVQRMMKELDQSESTVLIAALIDRECARLGYEEKCKPSAEVVHQRYRWARYRQLKFDSAVELPTEHMRLRRRLQLEAMETLMREDIPLADLDQGWVVARIAHLWDQVKDQRRGIPYTKSTIVSTIYNWVRRTYSKPVPPIFPPIDRRLSKKRRRKEEKRKEEKMNKKEEEEEVQSQSDDGNNDNDNEDSEDTAVNDDPDNNNVTYDEDTEDEGLATGMEVNEAEEEGEEEEKKKQNESATSNRSRGGDVGGREAAMSTLSPSAGGKVETTVREGLTGRELVLARRRHVHPFILSLLERFELSFPVGAHIHKLGDYAALLRSGGEAGSNAPAPSLEEPLYLIPSLLPEVRPLKLSSLWPLYCREGESIFGRCYRFEFVPKGFMGRLIIRLLAFPLAAQLYWRHGILAHIGRYTGVS
ncbi:uncharacterized protein ACA1_375280, partial [Acanthamoeba castellanii str. Neff]